MSGTSQIAKVRFHVERMDCASCATKIENADKRRWVLKRLPVAPMVAAFLFSLLPSGQALARGSMATERPWASEHIEGLPADIRRAVVARERACGNAAAAAHYFSVSIEVRIQKILCTK